MAEILWQCIHDIFISSDNNNNNNNKISQKHGSITKKMP